MNFVLRTAHAEEKKKGGHTNPDVRTIIIKISTDKLCFLGEFQLI